ncbi:MAG: DUF4440 domain-containing protein [Alphaproteobacteria bacterium]|nr:DUF4440 domain-containing protein [Alphaproteobacteria bacterium]
MNTDLYGALKRYADAWTAGDIAAIFACYHDDFTLHYGGTNPLSGDHVGKAASIATLAEVTRRTQRGRPEIIDVAAGDTRAVLIARERFTRDGRSDDLVRVLVFAVKDGLLAECWLYDQDQALVDWYLRD